MMDKIKGFFAELSAKITGKKKDEGPQLITTVGKTYEINLVPAVKAQMIKALKLRNLVLFICIVVSASAVGVVLVLFGIKGGQDIAIANQDGKLATMSAKLLGYEELGDLVTLQSQLDKLAGISENKTVLSRVFGALGVMLPSGDDSVQLSELRVDLSTNTLRMEGQADARVAPLIDYRVLESFKKSVELTKYDYGRYVDVNGTEIPTWCISEAGLDGSAYMEGDSYYGWWDLTTEGCAALRQNATVTAADEDIELFYSEDAQVETVEEEVPFEDLVALNVTMTTDENGNSVVDPESLAAAGIEARVEGETTRYIRQKVTRVRVWRTPQFTSWFNGGKMELNGAVTGVEHFESACINYSGVQQNNTVRWTSTNDCMLAPDGLTIIDSSNGRDEADNLVLKFTASVVVDEEFFKFQNKHMRAIGPMGQNVTDSYVQIGGMFTQEATECAEGDTECWTNSANTGGGATSSGTNANGNASTSGGTE